ncbi:GNAT family N-acetyltransferase [Alteromonas pelagimontana]|uniref:GNAT family N-acetyltransferase n=1 Tax=Alteromonas pelagimontana TaxID=1858656 RepID=A0A6M4MIS5_9ALTE|nr:GNAT family N-acetyltransferase [Alteromonas pelagimontana]QJR82510.1 GNAT family N-acetyltransferase [Alteromonas pelagimontana]
MELQYIHLTTYSSLLAAAPVMQQLRPHDSLEKLANKMHTQMKSGYRLLAAMQGEQVVALAGYVINEKLAWGKHLYIDDLVTVDSARGKGIGDGLMEACIQIAKEQQCESLHLDSGVQRFNAHRFYLRKRMAIASHHFALTLSHDA